MLSGTAEPAPKVGGPLDGVGHDLERTRALRVPDVAEIHVWYPNEALGVLFVPPSQWRCSEDGHNNFH